MLTRNKTLGSTAIALRSATRINDRIIHTKLYDAYAAGLYGTLLTWVETESVAQLILQQTFEAYVIEHLPQECENERPFICMIRIARKKYNSFLLSRHQQSSN